MTNWSFVGNARAVTGGVSENSHEMKQRYFPNIMCSLLLADDKLRPFVSNARAVTGVGEFRENPSKRSRDRAVNTLCSTNSVPVITD